MLTPVEAKCSHRWSEICNRMIIENNFNTVLKGIHIYYYMIVKRLEKVHFPGYEKWGKYISYIENKGITITELKNENFSSACKYCEAEMIRKFNTNKQNIKKHIIRFIKPFIFRVQDSSIQNNYCWGESRYGDTNYLGIYGIQIVDVVDENPKDELLMPKITRMNLYYSVIYDGEEYKIYFDEARNVNDVIKVFNQKYKIQHSKIIVTKKRKKKKL